MVQFFPKQQSRYNPTEQGAALIVVISILLVLTLLGVGTLNSAMLGRTINMNRIHSQHAEQIAKAGLNLVINRIEQGPADYVRALAQKASTGSTPCEQARTLCPSATSFFTTTGNPANVPHRGFQMDSLLARRDTQTTPTIRVYGDFLVLVRLTEKTVLKPAPGTSLTGASMCTVTLTLTGTGWVINPSVGERDRRRILAERSYRVQVQVAMQASFCG